MVKAIVCRACHRIIDLDPGDFGELQNALYRHTVDVHPDGSEHAYATENVTICELDRWLGVHA